MHLHPNPRSEPHHRQLARQGECRFRCWLLWNGLQAWPCDRTNACGLSTGAVWSSLITTVGSGDGEETSLGVPLTSQVPNFSRQHKPNVTPKRFTIVPIKRYEHMDIHVLIHSFCQARYQLGYLHVKAMCRHNKVSVYWQWKYTKSWLSDTCTSLLLVPPGRSRLM